MSSPRAHFRTKCHSYVFMVLMIQWIGLVVMMNENHQYGYGHPSSQISEKVQQVLNRILHPTEHAPRGRNNFEFSKTVRESTELNRHDDEFSAAWNTRSHRMTSNTMQEQNIFKLASDSSSSVSFTTWNAELNQYPKNLQLNFTLYVDPQSSLSLMCGFSRDRPCPLLFHALYYLNQKLERDFYNFTHTLTNFKRAIIIDIILMNDLSECSASLQSMPFPNLKYLIKIQSDPLQPLKTFLFECGQNYQVPIIGNGRLDIRVVMFHNIQLSIYQYTCVGINYIISNTKFIYTQILTNFEPCGSNIVKGDYILLENCQVFAGDLLYLFPFHYSQVMLLGMKGNGRTSLIFIQYVSQVVIKDWDFPFSTHFFQDVDTLQVLNSRIFSQSLTLNKVTNVIVQNTLFENFNGLDYASFYADFGNAVSFKNVSAENGEQFMHVQGYLSVEMSDVKVQHNDLQRITRPETNFRELNAIISITQTFRVNIVNSLFFNNTGKLGSSLYMDNIYVMDIVSSSFISNTAESGGAIYVYSFSKTYIYGRSEFKNCLFDNNSAQHSGGAVYIRMGFLILFTACDFRNNRVVFSGGAFYVGYAIRSILIDYSVFRNNTVSGTSAFESAGGAIAITYIFSSSKPQDFKPLQNALFIENSAPRGGGIYYYPRFSEGVQLRNITFVRNRATISGAAMFIAGGYQIGNDSKMVFMDNHAKYSTDVGYPIFTIQVYGKSLMDDTKHLNSEKNLNVFHHVIPGSIYEFHVEARDELDHYLPANSENLVIESQNPFVYAHKLFTHPDRIQMIFYILTNDTFFYGDQSFVNVTVTFAGEKSNMPTEVQVNIQSCPAQYKLDKVPTELGKIVYGCVEVPQTNYLLIFGIAIPLSIFTFIMGTIIAIVVTYSVKTIRRKLKKLQEKERAEHEMQQKLIDKNLIFDIDIDSEECVSGRDELSLAGWNHEMMDQQIPKIPKNMSSNSSGSKGSHSSHSKKSNSSSSKSDLEVPLLSYDPQQKEASISQINNFIIPIEDIKIERKIGEGGNGVVYLGLWRNLKVAIKSVKAFDLSEEESDEFDKEAAILSRLRHFNVVQFYGVTVTKQSKYMITEFLSKGSLDRIIYQSKNGILVLTLRKRINILIDVANGMDYLHSLKPAIIHRDLKPGNILLNEHFSSKVCDFGLVRLVGNTAQSLTKNVGTLLYLAPEIISLDNYLTSQTNMETTTSTNPQKKGNLLTKVDVYSFAIVMWELLFEKTPFLEFPLAEHGNNRMVGGAGSTYRVPILVSKGERPQVLENQEQIQKWLSTRNPQQLPDLAELKDPDEFVARYIQLMKTCWDQTPQNRPSFSQILKQLEELAKMFN
ncbi:hypothetical protein C9374_000448 [Naegleria lovaniensis]|uniref:Protein kinase domain-containing protein n=1 Tax=Naegleria lovaniensis TaxID=51637 RepID=A0AA88KNR0_NAELO|nr:uncharacterized protein C9374_000448 [Naegleria lovaniensis]KAG2388284.1 hypothetical protein C9374_000448 [Naegleria lovaniensis]